MVNLVKATRSICYFSLALGIALTQQILRTKQDALMYSQGVLGTSSILIAVSILPLPSCGSIQFTDFKSSKEIVKPSECLHPFILLIYNASLVAQCGRRRFDPWFGNIPQRRKWQPTPVFLPGKSHRQRSLVGYSSWDPRVRHDLATKPSIICGGFYHKSFFFVVKFLYSQISFFFNLFILIGG